jgi:hypothetical protein
LPVPSASPKALVVAAMPRSGGAGPADVNLN